jgi:hypothetical protein
VGNPVAFTNKWIAFSFYIKPSNPANRNLIVIPTDLGNAGNQVNAGFVLSPASLSSVTPAGTWSSQGARIVTDAIATGSGGNGWYRVEVNAAMSGSETGVGINLYSATTAFNPNYLGDGSSYFDIWNPVLNLGPGM